MIRTKSQGQLIVISGPSGVGKDTLCNKLLNSRNNMWISVSTTTRDKRPSEKEGIDYYYISKSDFEDRIKNNEFLEYAKVHNNDYYGTPKKPIYEKLDKGIDVILVIDIVGAKNVKKIFKDAIFIFILPPSMKELKNRIVRRDTESKEKMLARFKKAYKEINALSKYNYVVVNDTIENAVDKIDAIIEAEKCRVDRIEEVELNTVEEDIHEKLMDE